MSLRDRIASVGQGGPEYQVIAKDYGAATMQPTVRIQIGPGTLYYDDLTPLIAPDGGIIPATSPGTWGQLYMTGRRGAGR